MTRRSIGHANNNNDLVARVRDLEAQLEKANALNERLMEMLENQRTPLPPPPPQEDWLKKMSIHRPSKYDGAIDPVRLEDWIQEMTKLVECNFVPDKKRVAVVSFYFCGKADTWWRTVKGTLGDATWEQFIAAVKDQFLPPSLQLAKENEFLALTQGSSSVLEYTSKFEELSSFVPELMGIHGWKVRRYMWGLKPSIKRFCGGITNFEQLKNKALEQQMIDEEEERERNNKRSLVDPSVFREPQTGYPNEEAEWIKKPVRKKRIMEKCKDCDKRHYSWSCDGIVKCFNCGKEGHTSSFCPSRYAITSTGGASTSASRPSNPRTGLHAISKSMDDLHQEFEGKISSDKFVINNFSHTYLFR